VFCRFEGDGFIRASRVKGEELQSAGFKVEPHQAMVVDMSHFDVVVWPRGEVKCFVVPVGSDDFVDSSPDGL